MDGDLQTELVLVNGDAALAVRGEIDMATASQFAQACSHLATLTDRLLLDFSGVTFMDSSGLNVLILEHQRATTKTITICNASDFILRLLEISGLTDLFVESETVAGRDASSFAVQDDR